jgi:competence protein ComEA
MTRRKLLLSLTVIGLLITLMIVPVIAAEIKVNINTAPKEQLTTLKYVGDQYAQRIIEYRETTKFEKPEDIMNIKGIGQKIFDANKDIIIVKE